MRCQIVIPAINLWKKYTLPALNSIDVAMMHSQKHGIELRILLIDNASTDETKEEASERVSDTFSHVRNEERWGFQKSVNFGVNDAWQRGFDLCFVCNNDILLHERAIIRIFERFELASILEEEKDVLGMVTCMDVRGETDPFLLVNIDDTTKESVPESLHPNFSAFCVNQNCWDKVGEFDELYEPAYFEDNDFHYRMGLADMKGIVYPPAMFYHYGSRTQNEADKVPMVSGAMFENNRAFYAKKWGGVPGQEKFKLPYDNQNFSIKNVKQDW